jgi:sec-independent protein translocase protein TatA
MMNVLLGLWEPGMGQILLILVVVLVMFGAKKLPELARGFGQGIKEFKKATREVSEDINRPVEEPPKTEPTSKSQGPTTT